MDKKQKMCWDFKNNAAGLGVLAVLAFGALGIYEMPSRKESTNSFSANLAAHALIVPDAH